MRALAELILQSPKQASPALRTDGRSRASLTFAG